MRKATSSKSKSKSRSPSPIPLRKDNFTSQFRTDSIEKQKYIEYSKDVCDYGLTEIKKKEEEILSNLNRIKNIDLTFQDKEKLELENSNLKRIVISLKTKYDIDCGAFVKNLFDFYY